MKTETNKKILAKIQQENIQPKSPWYFRAKEFFLWVGTVLFLVIAAFTLGSFIYQSANAVLLPPHLFIVFSAARILLIFVSLIFVIYQIRRTKKAYKKTKHFYLGISIIIITLLGSLIFSSRLAGRFEEKIGRVGVTQNVKNYWSTPKTAGLLAGELSYINTDGYMIINDFQDREHIVDARYVPEHEQDVFIRALRVKMVGYERENIFYPCSIAPWKLRRAPKKFIYNYGSSHDGNIIFDNNPKRYLEFEKTFERKNEIIRNNRCR